MKKCINPACNAELDNCTDRCPECGRLQKVVVKRDFVQNVGNELPKPHSDKPAQPMAKLERHGFVSFWLGLVVVANLLGSIMNFLPKQMWGNNYPDDMIPLSYLCGVLNLIMIGGAFMLLNWNKKGFWVIGITAIVSGIITMIIGNVPVGLIGFFVLWLVLQIKKNGISYWNAMDKQKSN